MIAAPLRAMVTAVVATGLVAGLSGCTNKDAAAERVASRIDDPSFEASARAACKVAVHVFDTDTTLSKEPTGAQAANALESIDATFADLVRSLRQLPVRAADRAAVGAWLSDWDAYVAFGQAYAQAVRAGKEQALIRTGARAEGEVRRRIRAFAAVNRLSVCRFP